ncbi:MAG: TIGR03668 family PPOX class F420-dependent oxidoreductase [Acidimicrobiia bacterium]
MARVDRTEALAFLESSRVGHLATVRPDGGPHVVPITFARTGEVIVTMIDHKPKSTMRLQRLANIEANPEVSLLVDEWSEDWRSLRWVRVDGTALIHERDDMWRESRMALLAKYDQYRDQPPQGPAIVISIDRVVTWASTR